MAEIILKTDKPDEAAEVLKEAFGGFGKYRKCCFIITLNCSGDV